MTDDRELWAKAVALSLIHQSRWLSTEVEDLYPTVTHQQHPDGPRWQRRQRARQQRRNR
jgi:hypothetical protein